MVAFARPAHRVRIAAAASALVVLSFAAGCGSSSGSSSPQGNATQAADPALQTGRKVFEARCARCHGKSGGGGSGPKLSGGNVVRKYPNAEDEAQVVRNGKGTMPSWKNVLTADEIDAVVRYTREVLASS
jgi:mono/diheme cytochrome c family protein